MHDEYAIYVSRRLDHWHQRRTIISKLKKMNGQDPGLSVKLFKRFTVTLSSILVPLPINAVKISSIWPDYSVLSVMKVVMYKTIYVINIIIYMCSQHSNVL